MPPNKATTVRCNVIHVPRVGEHGQGQCVLDYGHTIDHWWENAPAGGVRPKQDHALGRREIIDLVVAMGEGADEIYKLACQDIVVILERNEDRYPTQALREPCPCPVTAQELREFAIDVEEYARRKGKPYIADRLSGLADWLEEQERR